MKTVKNIRDTLASLLTRLANWCRPIKKPSPASSTLSITRSYGAMIGICQWVALALLTNKTPHPGISDGMNVFLPQLDLDVAIDGDTKTFTLSGLVTTMQYSSFRPLTGMMEIRRRLKGDSRASDWIIVRGTFEMDDWSGKKLCFNFDGEEKKHHELPHLHRHFRLYFERLLYADNK